MPMTFEEAETKLKELAQGKYCGLRKYFYEDAKITKDDYPEYDVYMDRLGACKGKSWEEAFEKLEERMKGEK